MMKLIILFIACTALLVKANSHSSLEMQKVSHQKTESLQKAEGLLVKNNSQNGLEIQKVSQQKTESVQKAEGSPVKANSQNAHEVQLVSRQRTESIQKAEDTLSGLIANALVGVEGVLKGQNLIVDAATYESTKIQAVIAAQAHKTIGAVLLGKQAFIDALMRGYAHAQSNQRAEQVQKMVLEKVSVANHELEVHRQKFQHYLNSMNQIVQVRISSRVSKVIASTSTVIKEQQAQEQHNMSHLKYLEEELKKLDEHLQVSKAHAVRATKMLEEANQRAAAAYSNLQKNLSPHPASAPGVAGRMI